MSLLLQLPRLVRCVRYTHSRQNSFPWQRVESGEILAWFWVPCWSSSQASPSLRKSAAGIAVEARQFLPISPSFVKRLLGTNALDEVCLSCRQALLLLKLQQDWLWRQSSRMLPTVSTHRSGAPFASSKSICVQAYSLQASPSVSKPAAETVMEAEVRTQIIVWVNIVDNP